MDWREIQVQTDKISELVSESVSPLMARLLAIRGVDSQVLDSYLNPSLKDLQDPFDLPGIDAAASRLISSLVRHEKVVIAGDYDCDGICATAILLKTLRALSYDVSAFIPDRVKEGYGLSAASVDRLLREHPNVRLVVTVDNGINSVEEVSYLRSLGVNIIVTDHHLPGPVLPDCLIVNPKVSSPQSLSDLCGAGVSLMLAAAIVREARDNGLYDGEQLGGPLIVLAGLATVTDIMPLTGQNRLLVREALRLFPKYAPIGLQKLFSDVSRTSVQMMKSRDFGFCIGPRINAPGRISTARQSLDLIMTARPEEADGLAKSVEECNRQRKFIEAGMLESAIGQIVPGASAQVIALTDGDQGVAGIVASRILEKIKTDSSSHAVPVAVIVGSHGSARATDAYNVRDALAASEEALMRFGGHSAAAGFTVKEGALEKFRELFTKACAAQCEQRGIGAECVEFLDAWVGASDITVDFAESLSKLEPFGEANPEPVFAFKSVVFSDVRTLGAEGRHLQVLFSNGLKGVWWNMGEMVTDLKSNPSRPHDVLFKVSQYSRHLNSVDIRIVKIRQSV